VTEWVELPEVGEVTWMPGGWEVDEILHGPIDVGEVSWRVRADEVLRESARYRALADALDVAARAAEPTRSPDPLAQAREWAQEWLQNYLDDERVDDDTGRVHLSALLAATEGGGQA
jgi:hypothetical protein